METGKMDYGKLLSLYYLNEKFKTNTAVSINPI
jgi:hypothetical protein